MKAKRALAVFFVDFSNMKSNSLTHSINFGMEEIFVQTTIGIKDFTHAKIIQWMIHTF